MPESRAFPACNRVDYLSKMRGAQRGTYAHPHNQRLMAGRPNLRKFEAKIEEMGGDDVILDLIAAATPMREIAKMFDCSPGMLYRWRNLSDERREAWKEAREIAGHIVIEEGMEILDDGKPVTSAEASLLKSRAEYRKHLASLWNREELGEKKQASAAETLEDFAQAFVSIIQKANAPEALPAAEDEPEPEEADYEVLEESHDDDPPSLEGAG